jgi:hypothetical protein
MHKCHYGEGQHDSENQSMLSLVVEALTSFKFELSPVEP